MGPNYAMFSEPSFWSFLSLLTYLIWLHHQQHKTKRKLVELVDYDRKFIELATEISSKGDSFGHYASDQADVSIHHDAELRRVRESLLELAADISRVESSVSTLSGWPSDGTSNRVFERHSELPGEFPKEIRDSYLSGGWTCPNCGSHVEHNWIWWCKNCKRRTFPPVVGVEIDSPTDQPSTPSNLKKEKPK